ncbi:hypothetical protein YC2023_094424 [Brassica napus]
MGFSDLEDFWDDLPVSRLEVVWTSWKSSDKVVWTSRKSSGLLGSRLDFSERFAGAALSQHASLRQDVAPVIPFSRFRLRPGPCWSLEESRVSLSRPGACNLEPWVSLDDEVYNYFSGGNRRSVGRNFHTGQVLGAGLEVSGDALEIL